MPLAYEDLAGKDGSFENGGGTEQIVYFAPKSDFASIVAPPAFSSVTGVSDAAVIDGTGTPHTFNSGKKFFTLKGILDSGQVTGESVGERGGRSVKTNFSILYVGDYKKLAGLQRIMKEDEFIALAPLADGTVVQVGTEKRPALMDINLDSAKAEEGVRGATITIEAIDVAQWIYEGAIATTPTA